MRKAYSYQRFSSIKQKAGDSTKRLADAAVVFCKQFGLASACGVKPRRLVYFQNNEVKPETDFHHIHFLLGPHGLEKFTAPEICGMLGQKAGEFGFDDCKFAPYDPTKDGVGYVTKRVFRTLDNGQRVEIPPDFFLSDALIKIIKGKDNHE